MCVWVFIVCVPVGYVPVYMVVIISEMVESISFQMRVPLAFRQFTVYIVGLRGLGGE